MRADTAERMTANSIRNGISNLIEGSNTEVRVNIARLKTFLVGNNLVDVREVQGDPSPVAKFMTNFVASTNVNNNVDGSANRMYDFSDDIKVQIRLKNFHRFPEKFRPMTKNSNSNVSSSTGEKYVTKEIRMKS